MATDPKELEKLKSIRFRYYTVPIFLLVAAIAVLYHVFSIQLKEKPQGVKNEYVERILIQPRRGDILDRKGRLLACSIPEYDIYFDARLDYLKKNPKLIDENIDSIADGMAKIFANEKGCSRKDFYDKIRQAQKEKKMMKLITKTIDYNKLQAVKKLPLFRKGAYKGGLKIDVENNRTYPYGGMAKRTIGFLRKGEFHGCTGLEKAYDDELYGYLAMNQDEKGHGNVDGCDLVTTIDAEIQTITHEELSKTLKQYDAEWGCAIVMEVKTGEILSISNLSHNEDTADKNFYENWNYAVSNVCEPGSTIKLPSLMVAFEDKNITLTDTIDTGDGQIQYANGQLTVTDWNHKTQGGFHKLSVKDVFANSSNVGVSKIIDKYYVKTHKEWDYVDRIKSMNLDQPSGIDLVSEPQPKIKDPSMTSGAERWTGLTLLQMSYGYEIELSPLQILTFYNAVANDGKMMRPHLMKEIRRDSKVVKEFKPQSVKGSICKKETLINARKLMEAVVEVGTAKTMKNSYYKIAGKTGTAQTFEKGHYNKEKLRGSFCGYFPADNPKYSCIVVIQSKGTLKYSAVGVFKNIADRIFFMDTDLRSKNEKDSTEQVMIPNAPTGVSSDLKSICKELNFKYQETVKVPWVSTVAYERTLTNSALKLKKGVVPNFTRMGMRDALFLADSLQIRVQCEGMGRITHQSVREGTPYYPGDVVVLTLN